MKGRESVVFVLTKKKKTKKGERKKGERKKVEKKEKSKCVEVKSTTLL